MNRNKSKKGRNPSLSFQVQEILKSKRKRGHSKHADKKNSELNTKDYIYADKTYENYRKWCLEFTDYCKSHEPKPKSITECEKYIGKYIEYMVNEKKYSAYSIASKLAALTKIFPLNITEMKALTNITVPKRKRENIQNNRGESNSTFSEKNHPELVAFIKATGLRKKELNSVRVGNSNFEDKTITRKGQVRMHLSFSFIVLLSYL